MSGYLNILSQLTKPYFSILYKPHLNHPGKCRVTQGENLNKIGPNKFMVCGGVCGRGEEGMCFFGMHFSQSKNARLLNLLWANLGLNFVHFRPFLIEITVPVSILTI